MNPTPLPPLLPAYGQASHPVYRSWTYAPHGVPRSVLVQPVRRGGLRVSEAILFNVTAAFLQENVIIALRRSSNWNTAQIRNRVSGVLQMNNIGDGRHAHTMNLDVRDITAAALRESFERATAQGSNPDLDFYDVEWSFWINPLNFMGGRGGDGKLAGTISLGYKPGDDEKVGCAATAIALFLAVYVQGKRLYTQKKYHEAFSRKAKQLESDLGWEEYVPAGRLKEFVALEAYKDMRIVLIRPLLDSSMRGVDVVSFYY